MRATGPAILANQKTSGALVSLAEMIRTDKSAHRPNRQDAAAVQLQTGREKTCWSSLLVQNARLPVAGPIDGTQV
jgi:hypothetical protein